MQRVAAYLQVDVPAARWPSLVEKCTFEYMKANETQFEIPPQMMRHGAFIHQGRSRWREIFDAEMLAAYERTAAALLTPECRSYLETATLPACDGARD